MLGPAISAIRTAVFLIFATIITDGNIDNAFTFGIPVMAVKSNASKVSKMPSGKAKKAVSKVSARPLLILEMLTLVSLTST